MYFQQITAPSGHRGQNIERVACGSRRWCIINIPVKLEAIIALSVGFWFCRPEECFFLGTRSACWSNTVLDEMIPRGNGLAYVSLIGRTSPTDLRIRLERDRNASHEPELMGEGTSYSVAIGWVRPCLMGQKIMSVAVTRTSGSILCTAFARYRDVSDDFFHFFLVFFHSSSAFILFFLLAFALSCGVHRVCTVHGSIVLFS